MWEGLSEPGTQLRASLTGSVIEEGSSEICLGGRAVLQIQGALVLQESVLSD